MYVFVLGRLISRACLRAQQPVLPPGSASVLRIANCASCSGNVPVAFFRPVRRRRGGWRANCCLRRRRGLCRWLCGRSAGSLAEGRRGDVAEQAKRILCDWLEHLDHVPAVDFCPAVGCSPRHPIRRIRDPRGARASDPSWRSQILRREPGTGLLV